MRLQNRRSPSLQGIVPLGKRTTPWRPISVEKLQERSRIEGPRVMRIEVVRLDRFSYRVYFFIEEPSVWR